MPKYPEFKSKPIKGVKEEEWSKLTVGYLNKKDHQYAKTDYLRFKPELIKELAKDFTSTTSMIEYKGENQDQIRAAGRYIDHGVIDRPEWFEEVNYQTPEECIQEAKSYGNVTFETLPWGLRQKLSRHFESVQLRKLLPNIQWERQYRDDEDWIKLLSQFSTAAEMRNTSKEMKNLLSRLLLDKGVNYPKAFALANNMKKGHKVSKRIKRGKYGQRAPGIEQYSLGGDLIKTWDSFDELIKAGYKRSSIAGAIRGTDGHHKHKDYIWKYKTK